MGSCGIPRELQPSPPQYAIKLQYREWVGPNDSAWSGGNPDREAAAFYHVAQIEDLDTADGKRRLADMSMLPLASPGQSAGVAGQPTP